jgi:hypothetical protein
MVLEDKVKHKSRGLPSPDHADACVLAFAGYTVYDFKEAKGGKQTLTRSAILNHEATIKEQGLPPAIKHYLRDREFQWTKKQALSKGFNPGAILRSIYGSN